MTHRLDRADIECILPHREPFLFVDAVTEIVPGKRAVGELSVDDHVALLARRNDRTFLPPTVLVEAMAQVGAIAVLYPEENRGRAILFRSIEDMELHEPVDAGRTIRIVAEALRMRARLGRMQVTAYVDEREIASGVLSFALA